MEYKIKTETTYIMNESGFAIGEKEARLQEAVAAVNAKEHTITSAVRAFNVPRQILYDRINGKPPCNKAHETEQLLSHMEEKELL